MSNTTSKRVEIGNRIRQLRGSWDMNLQTLADEAGFSAGYLSEVERGNSVVSSEKLSALAHVLRVTTDYLLTGVKIDPSLVDPEIKIPAALSEFAISHDLGHGQTIRLLAGHNSLIAHRANEKEENADWSVAEWTTFYNKVKEYL